MKRLLIKICKISTTYNVKLSENISYELSLSLPTKLLKYWKRGQEPEPTYSLGCSQTRLYTVVAWGRFVLANSSLAYGQFYISCYSSELERGNQKCWQSSFDSITHGWAHTPTLPVWTYPDSAGDTAALSWPGWWWWLGLVKVGQH